MSSSIEIFEDQLWTWVLSLVLDDERSAPKIKARETATTRLPRCLGYRNKESLAKLIKKIFLHVCVDSLCVVRVNGSRRLSPLGAWFLDISLIPLPPLQFRRRVLQSACSGAAGLGGGERARPRAFRRYDFRGRQKRGRHRDDFPARITTSVAGMSDADGDPRRSS